MVKKLNVQKLVELKERYQANVKEQEREWVWQLKGYKTSDERISKLAEEARELRKQFDTEAVKLNEYIKSAEGRATARTIDAHDIIEALTEVDAYLGISKKAMKDTTVRIDCNAQKFPNAYKWTPESTIVFAKFTSTGWSIESIARSATMTKRFQLSLSDTAEEAYLKKAITLGE